MADNNGKLENMESIEEVDDNDDKQERTSRSKRSIINGGPPRDTYVKDGIRYKRDANGRWREFLP